MTHSRLFPYEQKQIHESRYLYGFKLQRQAIDSISRMDLGEMTEMVGLLRGQALRAAAIAFLRKEGSTLQA